MIASPFFSLCNFGKALSVLGVEDLMYGKRYLDTFVLLAGLIVGNVVGVSATVRVAHDLVTDTQTSRPAAESQLPAESSRPNQAETKPDLASTEAEKTLVEGSKRAILKTGMSEPYFNKHFRVVQVVDKPGDRRVVWRFSLNEYETVVNDSIGYYSEGGKRIDIHSVAGLLSSTSDMKRTITRRKAYRIMQLCLGDFAGTAVEYRAGASGKAGLFLTAASIPKPKRLSQEEARERDRKLEEREAREKAEQGKRSNEIDVIEEEEEGDEPPIFLGSVNLETGKCTKGRGQAGPPKPR